MESRQSFAIVGIGASAGGLEALSGLFSDMPTDTGLAFILVTHMPRDQPSSLVEILGRYTTLPVVTAEDSQEIARDRIYVCPPGHILTVADSAIHLHERTSDMQRRPIDVFLSSLAEDCGENCVGILLSGGGTDGTLGIKALKERGGLTMAQGSDGTAPQQSGMPDTAIAAGVVDLVLSVEDMASRLAEHARTLTGTKNETIGADEEEKARLQICDFLLKQVRHDFTGYKEKTFMRRVRRRMQVLQMSSLPRYIERLQDDPEEVRLLFRDLMIGVTNFFRDPSAFDALSQLVIPKLFQDKTATDSVRIWVPACATGEEVYSIAIVVREYIDTLRAPPKVQIFATDIDDAALSIARLARYPAPLMDGVSPERLKRFFVADDVTYSVTKDIREMCMFSPHSVIRDPPFSRVDLISCRNLLIYFRLEFQAQAIPVFHFALRSRGYLFLGTSENVSNHSDLFAPVDKRHRIFQRRDHVVAQLRLPAYNHHGRSFPAHDHRQDGNAMSLAVRRAVEMRVLERHAPAHVVVSRDGDIIHYSQRTGKYLESPPGLPSRQILDMARRSLRLDLRAALRDAAEKRRPVKREHIAVEYDDRVQMVDLIVEPFGESDNDPLFLILFNDVGTPFDRSQERPGMAGSRDEDNSKLEHELRDTRERLQLTIEEYETALEELKSSNEELQSVNEELQSTNEEMETSKEELQSVNEELQTVNAELNGKIKEVDDANNDLKNVFDSTEIATIFLDRNLVIRSFTASATAIFNLIYSDRGRPLTDIVSHLEGEDPKRDIQSVFETGRKLERRVKRADSPAHYLMRVLPYRARDNVIDGALVTFVDVTRIVDAEAHQRTLVDELNHRVRNMLTIVGAIANQTLIAHPGPKEFVTAFLGRLQAMARAYTLVSSENWTEVELRDIIGRELEATADGAHHSKPFHLDGPPILFKPSAALALGLVFHELVTNAVKYGALSKPKGKVAVHWGPDGGGADGPLVIQWKEMDGPEVKEPERRGLGLQLIERELNGTLGARAQFDYDKSGLKAKISIPSEGRHFSAARSGRFS